MYSIYKIVNLVNKKVYVGSTCRRIDARFNEHKALAKRGGKSLISIAIREIGAENFSIEEIESGTSSNRWFILSRESFWISKLETYKPETGYNTCKIASGIPMQSTRLKMSRASLGVKKSKNFCETIRTLKQGKKQSDIVRQKVAIANAQYMCGKYKELDDELIEELVYKGISANKISKILNVRCGNIYRRIKWLNLEEVYNSFPHYVNQYTNKENVKTLKI